MIRIFAAIAIPRAIANAHADITDDIDDINPLEPENWHVTLRFLGDMDEGAAEDVVAALETVRHAPFRMALRGVGFFGEAGGRKGIHALWAGVGPEAPLHSLRGKVEAALAEIGIEREGRKFRPHCTVARARKLADVEAAKFLKRHDALQSRPFDVEAFHLYESRATKQGRVYIPVVRFPLQGPQR